MELEILFFSSNMKSCMTNLQKSMLLHPSATWEAPNFQISSKACGEKGVLEIFFNL